MVRRKITLQKALDESDVSSDGNEHAGSSTRKGKSAKKNQPSTSKQQKNQTSTFQQHRQNQQPSHSQNRPQRAEEIVSRRKDKFPKHIKEIIRLQNSTELLISKAPFARLVKEIMQRHGDLRMQSIALATIQEATEIYLVQLLEDAYKLTLHRHRITLHPSDVTLVLYLRGQNDPGNK